jgi:hypothetical protein
MKKKRKEIIIYSVIPMILGFYVVIESLIEGKIGLCIRHNNCVTPIQSADPFLFWLWVCVFLTLALGGVFFGYLLYTNKFEKLKKKLQNKSN